MQGRSREATIGAHIQGWRRRLMDDTSIREGRKEGGKANEEGGGFVTAGDWMRIQR